MLGHNMKCDRSLLVTTLAFALLTGANVSAEESATDSDAAVQPFLEEVTVTAEKRSELLRDVPIAITALSGEAVTANRITDLWTLAATVPFVNMTQDSAVSQQLNIRGVVSVKLNDASAEPSVGMFVDEVYAPRMGSAFTDFFDLERIEIIRGPQGVLLGKNVIGGALSVVTAKPSFESSASTTISFGNYNSVMANGYATGKLSDEWAGRIAFQVRNHAGYNENIALDRELDNLSSYQGRGHLLYEKEDGTLSALFTIDYGHDETNGTIRAAVDDPVIPGIGTIQVYRDVNNIGPRQDFSPQMEYVKRESLGLALRIDWQAMENATLTSVTSYRDSEADWGYNQIGSGSPPSVVDTFVFQTEKPTSFTQELRLVSDPSDSRFDWIIGGYYEHDDIARPYQHIASTFPVNSITVFTGHSFYDASAVIQTSALFGQLGYRFNDSWKLTVGARYTRDDKKGHKTATCIDDNGDGACVTPFRGPTGTTWSVDYGKVWTKFTPQGVLEWTATDTMNYYVSIGQGFKGGGWDFIPPTPEAATISFDPETVVNYELGMKTDFFNRRLLANAAIFRMDYTDLQAQRTDLTCLCLITSNAGSARIDGIELELTGAVTDSLVLRWASSWLDPKYIDYDDLAGHVYDGNTMQRTPKFKYTAGLDYVASIGSWTDGLTLRVNWTHQSKIYWGPDNVSFEPGYGVLDANVRLQNPDSNWSVLLWGKNLTDELYSQLGLPFLGDLVEVWGPPRTYGVDFTYSF